MPLVVLPPYKQSGMTATGGTITYSGGYTIHTFTSSGTFIPSAAGVVDVTIVGGGGGGTTPVSQYGGGGRCVKNSATH